MIPVDLVKVKEEAKGQLSYGKSSIIAALIKSEASQKIQEEQASVGGHLSLFNRKQVADWSDVLLVDNNIFNSIAV